MNVRKGLENSEASNVVSNVKIYNKNSDLYKTLERLENLTP